MLILSKVIQGVGLCICLFDILNASEEIVHYGDGASYARGKKKKLKKLFEKRKSN